MLLVKMQRKPHNMSSAAATLSCFTTQDFIAISVTVTPNVTVDHYHHTAIYYCSVEIRLTLRPRTGRLSVARDAVTSSCDAVVARRLTVVAAFADVVVVVVVVGASDVDRCRDDVTPPLHGAMNDVNSHITLAICCLC